MTQTAARRGFRVLQFLVVIIAIIAAAFPLRAELVERWFTGVWYPPVQRLLTPISNLFPVAWLDVLAVAGAVWIVMLWSRRGGCPPARSHKGSSVAHKKPLMFPIVLRAMFCELGMPSISSLFPIPRIQSAFDENGTALDPALDRRFGRFAAELEWYAEALREARRKGVPY